MNLQTEARDCLYVNWAVPVASAPRLPGPLRYETHAWEEDEWIFVTALFFRFAGLRNRLLPMVRLSYPQMSLRLYVIDAAGVPSVLFLRMLVPLWVAPAARFVGRQPVASGRFNYPPEGSAMLGERACWRLEQEGVLEVTGRPGSPACGPGPSLGDWRSTVDSIRRRQQGYLLSGRGVRPIVRQQPVIEAVPMTIDVTRADLLDRTFAAVPADHWSRPHSAWLCPQIPVVFELGDLHLLPLSGGTRQMAAVPDGC